MASIEQQIKTQYEQTFKKNEDLEKELNQLKQVFLENSKAARQAIVQAGLWQQEFHGQEMTGVIALFLALREQVQLKEAALQVAIQFIGGFEEVPEHRENAIGALEMINKIIAGETIAESIRKQQAH